MPARELNSGSGHHDRTLAVFAVEVDLQARDRMHQNNRLDLLLAGPVDIGEALENALIGHLELQLRNAIAQKATMLIGDNPLCQPAS